MNPKGFTLIEIIIAIFILSTAVIGIFSAFYFVTSSASGASDQLTASYLVQEGMEIIRNIRDQYWLDMDLAGCESGQDLGPNCDNVSWVNYLTTTGKGFTAKDCTLGCEADYTTGTGLGSESPDSNIRTWTGRYLRMQANDFYGYDTSGSTSLTKFKRKIIILPIQDADSSSDHIIKVTTKVSWDQPGTIFSPGASADKCCPGDFGCSQKAFNCIIAEETLYDWYNYQYH
jgi:prepilin-type N-terminal cleavage/methylation domain-containing protein